MMNHRNTCAALAAALAAFACSLAPAQWAPFSALPGADRVDRGQVGGSARQTLEGSVEGRLGLGMSGGFPLSEAHLPGLIDAH